MTLHRRLFFLLCILLPTQVGFHFWPEWAYVLGRRVDYLSPTVYLTDVLIVFIVAKFLISNFKFLIKQRNFQILLLFAVLNIFFAKSQPIALYKWLKVFEFAGLGWYVVKNRYRISDIGLPLTIGVLYSSALALAQFLFQRSIGGPLWLLGERTFDIETPGIARWEGFGKLLLRPYGTFPHPNVLGGYLAVLLPAILQYANKPINKYSNKTKYFFAITIASGIVTLVVTFSRSAWIVAAGALSFVAWRKKTSVLVITSMVLVALFLWFRPSIADESVVQRARLNEAAISMWHRSPLVGVGLGNFVVELPRQSLNRYGNFLQPVHNIYLLVLAETGIVGFAMFILLLVNRIRYFVLGIREFRNTIYVIPLAMLLILGLVDHYPLTLQQGQLLFTLMLALSMLK